MQPSSRRKLSIHVEGHRQPAAAAAGAGAAPAAEGSGAPDGGPWVAAASSEAAAAPGAAAGAQPVERIGDLWAWKRRQSLYASFS